MPTPPADRSPLTVADVVASDGTERARVDRDGDTGPTPPPVDVGVASPTTSSRPAASHPSQTIRSRRTGGCPEEEEEEKLELAAAAVDAQRESRASWTNVVGSRSVCQAAGCRRRRGAVNWSSATGGDWNVADDDVDASRKMADESSSSVEVAESLRRCVVVDACAAADDAG